MTHEELRDLLPDLLHGRMEGMRLSVLEGHLAGCAECREELAALKLVKDAPSFEPLIDAARIASSIPPYARPLPATQPVIRRPSFQLLLAAAAILVIVGSVVINRNAALSPAFNSAQRSVAVTPAQTAPGKVTTPSVGQTQPARTATASTVESTAKAQTAGPPRELQVATALEDLSDNGVKQLLRELDTFDGLPSSEPDPVGFSDSSGGGAR